MEGVLSGQICIVTGASRGIGLAIATRFKQEGAIVYGLSRTKAEADIEWISCDVTDELSVESAIDQILKKENRIDILVNNAGITRDGLLMRMKTEDWEAVLNSNLRSAFFLSRAVSRIMLKQRSGCILNMSSVVGLHGNGGQANYAASKAGLIGFTKSLAKELGSRNIRVNAIAPGYVETSMTQVLPDTAKENLKSSIPLGRPGTPGDIAEAALFLCSSYAAYITGVVLNVDGGMGM
ncbi:MAG TPA: 3-oxoacyl-[acyl-carrier-protein] reductase [Rectinema sp.]|jgi:3-oxoacyl-[acyl-carrier protein] reductase|nr:3-oxoacyl-[acyl-carrier-protein] reductase [Spirochaetaceae bacterium]HNY98349.1 3-oxoacyl-[acyl-carrier-protein] reductase [Rectinema sp.]HOD58017.1 3-oxoacyl-[acyl-carrier-protein] reductase [Rectinema sp.]HOE75743.1 3-oxoacyl-[acyl-carrier-protein] reductase [Rectinema sp.]HOH04930.1 3-oxoacyl-[acyl-carrier-protein] reductase [Rectinema sp.]